MLGSSSGRVITGKAETLVLHLSDVLPFSRDFQLSSEHSGPLEGSQTSGRWLSPSRSQYERWGRIEDYQTTFWRPRLSGDTRAPVEVYSRVDLFKEISGAQQAFEEESRQRKEGSMVGALPIISLGDAWASFSITNGPFTQHLILFQKGSAAAQVLVTGYSDRFPQEAAMALAGIIEERMDLIGSAP